MANLYSAKLMPASFDANYKQHDAILIAGFALSGFTALGLELVWIKILGLAFGAERFGILAVLSGFFGGMAVGAWLVQRYLVRIHKPVWVYIACEVVIAFYALTSPGLMLQLARWLPSALAPLVGDNQSTLALAVNTAAAMLVLLPATAAMGATTALLVEAWRRRMGSEAQHLTVGWLYAANTAGAVGGVAVVTYLLIPALGLKLSAWACLATSLAAIGLVYLWGAQNQAPAESTPRRIAAAKPSPPKLMVLLAATGFCGIGLEYLAVQVLAQVLEDTVYTFANLLLVYLVGTAIGAYLYTHPAVQRAGDAEKKTRTLLLALAAALILSGVVLGHSNDLVSWLVPRGSSYAQYLSGDFAIATLVFILPAILMGMLFSHLIGQFVGRGIGTAYAVNMLGGTLGPIVISVLLLPVIGPTGSLFFLIFAYLGLYIWVAERRQGVWLSTALVAGLALFVIEPLVVVRLPSGFSIAAQRVSAYGVTTVGEHVLASNSQSSSIRVLQVNQNFLMGGTLGHIEQRMGHLPVLAAPNRSSALYLGVGTGISAGAATRYADIAQLTAVELVPDVVELLPWFAEHNGRLYEHPRTRLLAQDARRFVSSTSDQFGVIVADLFHPSRDGAGSLYTVEHFTAIRERLTDDGIFVQWLPIYQMRPDDARLVVRTFLSVFPTGNAVLANLDRQAALGLVGWRMSQQFAPLVRLNADLAKTRTGFSGLNELLASFLMGHEGLATFAGSGALNTDTNQRMIHDAAQAIATDDPAAPVRTLMALMPLAEAPPAGWLTTESDMLESGRRFAKAAQTYIAGDIAQYNGTATMSIVGLELMIDAYAQGYLPALYGVIRLAVRHPLQAREAIEMLISKAPHNPNSRELSRLLQTASSDDALISQLSSFAARQ